MDAPQQCLEASDQDQAGREEKKPAIYIPREQIAAKNYSCVWREEHDTWLHTYDVPHSCRHCRQFKVIQNPKPFINFPDKAQPQSPKVDTPTIRICIANEISEIRSALDDRCPLFERFFGEWRGSEDSEMLEVFDVDGSGMVQAMVWGKGRTADVPLRNYADADVHGYVDLRLLHRTCDPQTNWLRAIIQPGKLPLIVSPQFSFFCSVFLKASY